MRIRHLKQLRIFFALVFFLPALFLFLDFRDSGFRAIAGEVLFLQFVPSLLQFMDSAAIGAAGFILVLILTLVFGRVYCSFVCPLGIYQDLISRLARKRISWPGKKRKRYRSSYSRPHYFLWYAVLILTVLFFLAGSGLVLNLLDPFSSFGRIVSALFRPLVLGANNLGALVLEQLGNHSLYRVRLPVFVPVSTGIALVTLMAVGWLSARHGRLYCNTLCPVGALLGLFSKFRCFGSAFHRMTAAAAVSVRETARPDALILRKRPWMSAAAWSASTAWRPVRGRTLPSGITGGCRSGKTCRHPGAGGSCAAWPQQAWGWVQAGWMPACSIQPIQ